MSSVTVIAEAGVNHNGSLDMARALVDAAVYAGADVVKFQTFRADSLASKGAPKADYQKVTTGEAESQYDMLRALELSHEAHEALLTHCRSAGIEFLSTPFDEQSLAYLAGRLGLRRLKIGSGDMNNAPLLLAAAGTDCDIVLSTGMATLEEVGEALGVLAFGFLGGTGPNRQAFTRALSDPAGRDALRRRVTVLQCTTDYPAAPHTINLRAMDTLASAFGVPIGFSDHSEGTAIAIAAVGRGAVMIEKHLTLDRNLPGPDHRASLEPKEFREMVASIRAAEQALGDGKKEPHDTERANMPVARKSIIASTRIAAGERFTRDNLAIRRPGNGLPPMVWWDLIDAVAVQSYEMDDPILPAELSGRASAS